MVTHKKKTLPRTRKFSEDGGRYQEQYGILNLDWDLTAAGIANAKAAQPACMTECGVMQREAERIISENGFERPREILERVESSVARSKVERAYSAAIIKWGVDVGRKGNGFFSPEAIAARFLGPLWLIKVSCDFDSPISLRRIVSFADGYRNFHFELFGMHGKAFAAKQMAEGRATAHADNILQAQTKRKLVAELFRDHCEKIGQPRAAVSASSAAAAIIAPLNQSLGHRKLRPMTIDNVRKTIGILKQSATS